LVVGTSNKCELFVGYFTKGGDNVNDIAPLYDLTVDEVIAVGEELGVPHEILHRVPSDGLSGVSDEEKMGVTYSDIAKFMAGEKVDEEVYKKIEKLHNLSRHKFTNNAFWK
jgi:NAD+ synthase